MERQYDVLIVGGGHGGAAAAMALRHRGFGGSIAIVGEEPDLPFDRPPLSKDYLAGDKPFERMVFRSAASWAERRVTLLLGPKVEAIEAAARKARTSGGSRIGFSRLIWAAGGRAKRIGCPGGNLRGVHSIRSRADVDRIIAELPEVRQVAVVGGGYIGLEAAAVLTKLGKHVILLEAQDRVLSRVAGEPVSRFYEAEHRARGVEVRLRASVDSFVDQEGRVAAVRLGCGELLPAQMVIVAIGIEPVDEPLIAAGAEASNGIRIDGQCRTSLADIYAIGDCAEHRNHFVGGAWVRLESVQNATDQAAVAAASICGGSDDYAALPWFWSNQYDLRLQTVGLSQGHDELVMRGDPGTRSFSVVYLRGGAVVALDCVNATRDYVQGRALIAGAARPDRQALADPSVPIKTLA